MLTGRCLANVYMLVKSPWELGHILRKNVYACKYSREAKRSVLTYGDTGSCTYSPSEQLNSFRAVKRHFRVLDSFAALPKSPIKSDGCKA